MVQKNLLNEINGYFASAIFARNSYCRIALSKRSVAGRRVVRGRGVPFYMMILKGFEKSCTPG